MKNLKRLFLLVLISFSASVLAGTWAQSSDNLVTYRSADADTIVKAQLLTTYSLNEQLRYIPIKVGVNHGVVNLSGVVETPIQKALAEGIAHSANGVTQLVSNIAVDPNATKISPKGSFGQQVQDLSLTANITANLQKAPEISPFTITVSTFNSAVTLTGEVSTFAQKELAGKIATRTPGVVMVINNLKIVSNI